MASKKKNKLKELKAELIEAQTRATEAEESLAELTQAAAVLFDVFEDKVRALVNEIVEDSLQWR